MKRSLNLKMIETPYQTYIRKMPKDGIFTDEESGEITMPKRSRKRYTHFGKTHFSDLMSLLNLVRRL
jgi:hypothetical protein